MSNTPLYIPELEKRGLFKDLRQEIWGDSFNWSWVRPISQVNYLTIHHTVTDQDASPNDIALLHKARGWGGVGYHFINDKNGVIHYVGDISTARANVLNQNEKIIGLANIGDFTKHLPTDKQIISMHYFYKWMDQNRQVFTGLRPGDSFLNGHKDMQATACPGSSWPNDMRSRVVEKIPYTPIPEIPIEVPIGENDDVCMPKADYDKLRQEKRNAELVAAGVLKQAKTAQLIGALFTKHLRG